MMHSKFVTTRFCATCDPQLYWPYHHTYLHCPQCGMTTTLKSVSAEKAMSVADAKKLIAHIEFEKYVNEETDAERAERHDRAQDFFAQTAEERKTRTQALDSQFRTVIEDGGFTKPEQELYKAIERALPPRNNPRYADPLAD